MAVTERSIFFRLLFSSILLLISLVTTALVWGHWAYTLDTCPLYNCGCIFFGIAFENGFAGGNVEFCQYVTYAQIPVFLTCELILLLFLQFIGNCVLFQLWFWCFILDTECLLNRGGVGRNGHGTRIRFWLRGNKSKIDFSWLPNSAGIWHSAFDMLLLTVRHTPASQLPQWWNPIILPHWTNASPGGIFILF